MARDFQLERKIIWREIRDRLAWSDFRRVKELFMLFTIICQDEGRDSYVQEDTSKD